MLPFNVSSYFHTGFRGDGLSMSTTDIFSIPITSSIISSILSAIVVIDFVQV